jgi:hypothetical protein
MRWPAVGVIVLTILPLAARAFEVPPGFVVQVLEPTGGKIAHRAGHARDWRRLSVSGYVPIALTRECRMRACLIVITFLAASMVARPAAVAQEKVAQAIDIARVDPIRLAERDIAAGRYRVLCVSQGWGCQVPVIGTSNYERCYSSAASVEPLAWFGDVIGGDDDLRVRHRSVEFASKYNVTLVRELDRLGKRQCPAGEDWDALVRSVFSDLDGIVPGFPQVDISRDGATDHYFRIATDYPAY